MCLPQVIKSFQNYRGVATTFYPTLVHSASRTVTILDIHKYVSGVYLEVREVITLNKNTRSPEIRQHLGVMLMCIRIISNLITVTYRPYIQK
jgi:hypothetical protein